MTIILGIDPGLRNCGWGVIRYQQHQLAHIASGVIKPHTDLPFGERLEQLHFAIQQLVTYYQPGEAALEETFVSVNGQSTLKLGQARGAILLSLRLAGLPVAEYAARLVKKSISGNGRAEKTQMQQMVKFLLPHSDAASADAADALAIAICHAHHRNALLTAV